MTVTEQRVEIDSREKARVQWRCRRGMLELDLLLQPFVEQCFDSLSKDEKLVFFQLMDMQDQELLECLMLQTEPEDLALLPMIHKVRDSV